MASSNDNNKVDKLHFILIPLMSRSHLIPFSNLARLIADRGPTITMVTTTISATASFAPDKHLKINLLPLPSPNQLIAADDHDALALFNRLTAADGHLRSSLLSLLRGIKPRPTCIVSDFVLPWTADVAREFRIPRLVFHVISCFTLLCTHNIRLHNAGGGEAGPDSDQPFPVPGIPERIEFTRSQLPRMTWGRGPNPAADWKEAELAADGVLVNTFEELEPSFARGYGRVIRKLWCVGPVSLNPEEPSSLGGAADAECDGCLRWLESRAAGSVIYACFGSLKMIPSGQLIEIGSGLADSGRPFIWVIRGAAASLSKLDEWMAAEGFEERIAGRGLVLRGWAPQVRILSHAAVGGFVTHCGWNSTLEAVSCGVPMVTWPLGAEQFLNEKLVVQVLRIGVRIGVERLCVEEEEERTTVKREAVTSAVEVLMGEGEEAQGRRERARELGRAARRSVEEGGSSHTSMSMLIQEIVDKFAAA